MTMVLKVRRGAAAPRAKLTEEQVRAIRASTETNRVLGLRHGVHPTTIGKIKRHERW